jgi:hypothetical protein
MSGYEAGAVRPAARGTDQARRLTKAIIEETRREPSSTVRPLAEIRAAGFTGSYTQLKAFVRQVRFNQLGISRTS